MNRPESQVLMISTEDQTNIDALTSPKGTLQKNHSKANHVNGNNFMDLQIDNRRATNQTSLTTTASSSYQSRIIAMNQENDMKL